MSSKKSLIVFKIPRTVVQPSLSKQLRQELWYLWNNSDNEYEDFEDFYDDRMKNLIAQVNLKSQR